MTASVERSVNPLLVLRRAYSRKARAARAKIFQQLFPRLTTEKVNEVRDWTTSMKNLPLFRTRLLVPNREYYVRVSATARPSYGSSLGVLPPSSWIWGCPMVTAPSCVAGCAGARTMR